MGSSAVPRIRWCGHSACTDRSDTGRRHRTSGATSVSVLPNVAARLCWWKTGTLSDRGDWNVKLRRMEFLPHVARATDGRGVDQALNARRAIQPGALEASTQCLIYRGVRLNRCPPLISGPGGGTGRFRAVEVDHDSFHPHSPWECDSRDAGVRPCAPAMSPSRPSTRCVWWRSTAARNACSRRLPSGDGLASRALLAFSLRSIAYLG